MSNKSISALLLAASLFSSLGLTGAATEALAEPLRTSRATRTHLSPGLNPTDSTDLMTPSELEDTRQVRPGLNPTSGSHQIQHQPTDPVAWPPGPPCDSDLLPPGHWGAPCIIRAVDDYPFD